MPLTRLDNLISSKTGKYLYVSPDDFNATDALSNRGNSPVTPFKSIQRAFLEIARYSYLPGFGNDRFDQFSIMLMPGIHYIDNRPGLLILVVLMYLDLIKVQMLGQTIAFLIFLILITYSISLITLKVVLLFLVVPHLLVMI